MGGLYEVIGSAAPGPLGPVYHVRHRDWGVELMATLVAVEPAVGEAVREALDRYARLAFHPSIVTCWYLRSLEQRDCLFTEHVEGTRLGDVLAGAGRQEWDEILDLSLQCLDALAFAHAHGIVHGSLTAADCIITPRSCLRLGGFGVAPVLATALTRNAAGGERGADEVPEGVAPEQLDPGLGTVGPWTDVYAFGVILSRLVKAVLSGAGSGNGSARELPGDLEVFIQLCLEREPHDRFQSADEARQMLRSLYQAILGCSAPADGIEDPQDVAEGLSKHAMALVDLGRIDEALAVWERAVSLDPTLVEAIYHRGVFRWRRGEIGEQELLQDLAVVRSGEGATWEVDFCEGLVHMERRDFAAAEQCFARALRASDGDAAVDALLREARQERAREDGSTPPSEEPVVEPALAEEPVVAPALAEEAVVEPALAEEPVVEPALAEEPAVEPALAEEPVVEPALAEEPVVEPALAEEPVVAPALAEEPVVEPALAEEPVVAPALAEEPVVEPALAEEPVVAPPPAEEPDPGSRCAAMVLRGLELAGVGLADEADATWGRLVSEHPSQPAAVYHYGVRAWRRGEIDDETLVTALQRVHGDHDPWELPYYLGLVHMERQDLLLASAGFENALAAGGDPVLLASLLSRAGGDHAGPCVSSRVITLEGTRRVTGVQWVASQALILDEEHLWALDPLTGTVRRLAAGRADTMASLSEGGGVVLGWRDTLAFLDLEEQTLTHEIRGAGPVSRLCASPRGHHVAFTVDGEPLVPHLWEIGADRHVLDDEALESLVSSLSSAQREALLSLRGRVFTGSELECELVGLVGGHWARARVLAATNRSVVRLHGHRAPVSALAFSGDGALLVSADAEGTLRTWGTTSGLPWGAFEHGEPVRALTVSRDGRSLACVGERWLTTWDLPRATLRARHPLFHHGRVVAASWTPRGIYTVAQDSVVKLHDPTCGRVLRTFMVASPVGAVAPCGEWVLFARDGGCLDLWGLEPLLASAVPSEVARAASPVHATSEASSRSVLQAGRSTADSSPVLPPLEARIPAVRRAAHRGQEATESESQLPLGIPAVVSPRVPASAGADPSFRWSILAQQAGETMVAEPATWPVETPPPAFTEAAPACAGLAIALGPVDEALQAREYGSALSLLREVRQEPSCTSAPAVLDRWRRLYVGCRKTGLRAVHRAWHLQAHQGAVTALAVPLGGGSLVTAGQEGTIRFWSLPDGQPGFILDGAWGTPLCLDIDSAEQMLVSGHEDGHVRAWHLASRQCRQIFEVGAAVHSVRLSHDCAWMVSASEDGKIRLWEVASGRCVHTVDAMEKRAARVRLFWNSEQGRLISCGELVRRWAPPSWRPLATVEDPHGFAAAAATADARVVLLGSNVGTVTLWNLAGSYAQSAGKAFDGPVRFAALTPDGQWAVLSGRDSQQARVQIRDVTAMQAICQLEEVPEDVSGLLLVPDGSQVVVAGGDGCLVAWGLDWELEPVESTVGDARVQSVVADFVQGCTPPQAVLPLDRPPTAGEVAQALKRSGTPCWGGRDFFRLQKSLGVLGHHGLPEDALREALLQAGAQPMAADEEANEVLPMTSRSLASRSPVLPVSRLRFLPVAHEQGVTALALSVDGSRAATACRDGCIRVWTVDDWQCKVTLGRGSRWNPASALAFAPDGEALFSGHGDGSVRHWDLHSASVTMTIHESSDAVSVLALSGDGLQLLCGTAHGAAWVWDVAGQRVSQDLELPHPSLHAAAYTSRGQLLLASDRFITVWDAGSATARLDLVGHTQRITSVCPSADGRVAVSSSLDHTVRLWDLDDGNCLGILFDTDADAVHHAVLVGNAPHVVAATGGHLRLWRLADGAPLGVLESPAGEISHLAWSPSRGVLVGAGSKGALAIWDVRSEPGEQGGTGSHYVAGSPIARTVGGALALDRARVLREQGAWGVCTSLRSISLAHVLTLHAEGLSSLVLGEDTLTAVSAGRDGRVHVVDLHDGCVQRTWEFQRPMEGAWIGTGGHKVLSVDAMRTVRVHDVASGELEHEMPCLSLHWPMAASVDHLVAVAASDASSWQLVDLAGGRLVRVFLGMKESMEGIVLSSDCRHVVTWSAEGWVQVWELATGLNVATHQESTGSVHGLSLSPDARVVAWGNGRGELCFWTPQSGAVAAWRVSPDETDMPDCTRFSADGRRLAFGGLGVAGIVDVESGACLARMIGPPAPSLTAAPGADMTLLASAGIDGLVKIWALEWDCGGPRPADDMADGMLDRFLTLHTPPRVRLDSVSSEEDVAAWLRREGEASWTEDDVALLRRQLRLAGYGDLPQLQLEQALTERMVRKRQAEQASRAMLLAAANGSAMELARLLTEGADLGVRNEQGSSVVHLASAAGNLEGLRFLLARGVAVGVEDGAGCTPLLLASEAGCDEVVHLLLEAGADPQACDPKGCSPLHLAATQGHLGVVRILLDRGADVRARSRWADDERTPLHHAAAHGQLDVVVELCERGAELLDTDVDQRTALHLAAQGGHARICERLIAFGADVDARDWAGNTALHAAAERGFGEIIEILVRCGAHVDDANRASRTPLRLALEAGHSAAALALVRGGARTVGLSASDRKTLYHSRKGGLLAGLGDLLAPQVHEGNARGEKGTTPVHEAVQFHGLKKLKRLLDKGANPNLRDGHGRTPLYLAVAEGNVEAIRALLNAGAYPRYRYEKGTTLLHVAARRGDLAVVEMLLAKGADIDAEDDVHLTPLAEATVRKHIEVVRLLLERGANGAIAAEDLGTPFEICRRMPRVFTEEDRVKYAEIGGLLAAADQAFSPTLEP